MTEREHLANALTAFIGKPLENPLSRGEVMEAARIALAALTAPAVPEGWKLVPIEPTDEMCKAAFEARDKWPSAHCDNWREQRYSFAQPRYKAMLDAAPAPGGEHG